MGRKIQITKKIILETALQMLIRDGYTSITVKTLAAEIGCSTQPIVWHFEIAHEYSVCYGLFSKTITEVFNCVLQPFSAIKTSCVNKYGKLVGVILWDQLNCSDCYCTDF